LGIDGCTTSFFQNRRVLSSKQQRAHVDPLRSLWRLPAIQASKRLCETANGVGATCRAGVPLVGTDRLWLRQVGVEN
jgi:hypothetical protein